MPTDKAVIEKYLKVQTLAQRGVEGERQVAQNILEGMRKTYPGIDLEVQDMQTGWKPKNIIDDVLNQIKKAKERRQSAPPEKEKPVFKQSFLSNPEKIKEEISSLDLELDANERTLTIKMKIPVKFLKEKSDLYGTAGVAAYSHAIGDRIREEMEDEWLSAMLDAERG